MSSRSWQLRIQDILDAISRIQRQTENLSFEEFELLADAPNGGQICLMICRRVGSGLILSL